MPHGVRAKDMASFEYGWNIKDGGTPDPVWIVAMDLVWISNATSASFSISFHDSVATCALESRLKDRCRVACPAFRRGTDTKGVVMFRRLGKKKGHPSKQKGGY